MAKINHQRPIFKIIDGYRRLRHDVPESEKKSAANKAPKIRKNRNPMPDLSPSAETAVLEMFDVFNKYLEVETAFVKTLLPGKKRARDKISKQLEQQKVQLVNVCTKVLLTVIELALTGDMSLRDWLVWFQKETEKNNNIILYDLLVAGFKPAFAKVEGLLDTI